MESYELVCTNCNSRCSYDVDLDNVFAAYTCPYCGKENSLTRSEIRDVFQDAILSKLIL